MADNTTLPTGAGGDTIATDELATLNGGAVSGFKVQRVKVGFGSDGALRDVDAANGLPVLLIGSGLVSSANSSAVALAANAVFTGTAEDLTEYATIVVSVFADQASATDGLQVQQSSNGTNWDIADSYRIPANTGKTFSMAVAAKFCRVMYTNGTTINTAFRLQAVFHKSSKKSSSVKPQDARSNENDFEESLSFGMVYNGTSWDRLRGSAANGMSVSQPDIIASGTITTQNLVPAGVATAGSAVELTLANAASLSIQVTGTYTGALSLQATIDNVNWVTMGGTPLLNINTGNYLATITSALQGIFQAECSGFIKVRVTALAAVTGTATVSLRAVNGAAMVALDAALPTGANTIGAISNTGFNATLSAETTKVIGTINVASAQTLATVTTVGTVTTLANGQTAHSSSSTGSPVRVGGRVNTAVDTTLAAGDASDIFITTSGAQVVKPYAAPEVDWQFAGAAGGIINTTDVVLRAAGAAGVRNYLTSVSVQNASATTATEVVIKDGATVIWRGYVGTSAVLNSAVNVTFPTPLRGTAATALNVACITTAAAVYVNAQGYQAA